MHLGDEDASNAGCRGVPGGRSGCGDCGLNEMGKKRQEVLNPEGIDMVVLVSYADAGRVRKSTFLRRYLESDELAHLVLKQTFATEPPAFLIEGKMRVNKAYDEVAAQLNTEAAFSSRGGITRDMCR